MTVPSVSVIVPCRNERAHIGACLDALLATTYPHERLEILVVDGMSDDGTRQILAQYAARHPIIRLLDNERRITPTALNLGVLNSRGEILMPIGAHNESPPEYIPTLVRHLTERGADNVGGVLLTEPGGSGPVAHAIAIAMAHPFGVGNSMFRIGVTEPRWVDTVPFGCYRRQVFDRIGLFDEDLIRNQDDELNLRLVRMGGRILLVPDVVSRYYARGSLGKTWRMYYQYGYFKPLVIRKVGAVLTCRQLVPGAFVAALVVGAVLSAISSIGRWMLAAVVAAYLIALVVAIAPSVRRYGVARSLCLTAAFPVLHLSYGSGFLRGACDFLVLRRGGVRGPSETVTMSR